MEVIDYNSLDTGEEGGGIKYEEFVRLMMTDRPLMRYVYDSPSLPNDTNDLTITRTLDCTDGTGERPAWYCYFRPCSSECYCPLPPVPLPTPPPSFLPSFLALYLR